MYRNFFSLSDLPFSIAPDPKYIFMSDRHKEALSHLTYGQGEIGGFALLTGEVGTGKTTVSRCLMEQLPENTQAAFILNPMLSSQELLATLCDKLSIEYNQEDVSLKNLTDRISEKLLSNHENGINTLLIIDEAQHLQPEVLEQLRLLTNLETNTKKLLQVILIGQPELQQLLQRRDLRQLAQRITARYHLMPLTKAEVKQYIQHRLSIADCARNIFDKGAIDKIHQLSQGVPRLINLLCHSSLMLAYNQNDSVVNKKLVITASQNVLGTTPHSTGDSVATHKFLLLATAVSVIGFIGVTSFWWGQKSLETKDIVVQQISESQVEQVAVIEDTVATTELLKQAKQITEANSLPENTLPVSKLSDEATLNYAMHTVKHGESLYSISLKYNTKIKALMQWNNITKENDISIGDKLHVIAPAINEKVAVNQHSNTSQSHQLGAEKPREQPDTKANYNVKQVEGVSEDLLALFQEAIDETDEVEPDLAQLSIDIPITSTENIKGINQLTVIQQDALPKMQFEQHIYSSDGQGWVTVNGRDRYEGDYINSDLIVEKILPQEVILSYRGERFSMPALTNW